MATSEKQPRSRFQWGLGTLLYLVLLIGLGLGWYQDHQRLERVKARQPQELALYRDQRENLEGIVTYGFGLPRGEEWRWAVGRGEFPWTGESYLQFLASLPSRELNNVIRWDRQFEVTTCRLKDAPDEVYHAVFLKMLPYLKSTDVDTRRGMAIALCYELKDSRQRIQPYRAETLALLLELLDDPDQGVRIEAIRAIGAYGPEASVAAGRLKQLATQEEDFNAALALARVDPRPENRNRVMGWITDREFYWEEVASRLTQGFPREEAIAFLRQEYFRTESEMDRLTLVESINQLEIERLEATAEGKQ